MPELIPVLDQDTIARKVADVARQISSDYQHAELVLIGVLKGAFVFMADLIRQLNLSEVVVDFVQLASYGSKSKSSGAISLLKDLTVDIRDKDVLICEDILDTGITMDFLYKHLLASKPRTIKICTLIDKRERREIQVEADYVCHNAEGFLVGYGLDYAEIYRNLPGIYQLNS